MISSAIFTSRAMGELRLSDWCGREQYQHDAVATTPEDDTIQMKCQSFEFSPAFRASAMVHEATHANNWPKAHVDCPTADCSYCCDAWDFHGVRDPAGALDGSDNHYAYQVSIEYLADLSEFAFDSWPLSVLELAEKKAEQYPDERITDPPRSPAPAAAGPASSSL